MKMKHTSKHPLVTQQELDELLGSDGRKQPSGVDRGFRYRNAYLLIVVLFFVIRLLFFPANTASPFNTPMNSLELSRYMQWRGIFVLALFFIYWASYVKDWFFEKTSLIIATFSLAALVMDFFNVYAFIQGTIPPTVIFGIFIRVGAIYCLFMNSIRDNRAPAMPRHLFS